MKNIFKKYLGVSTEDIGSGIEKRKFKKVIGTVVDAMVRCGGLRK